MILVTMGIWTPVIHLLHNSSEFITENIAAV